MENEIRQPQSPESFKIQCNDFPSEFLLDKTIAKDYFKSFGKVKRVAFKPRQRICTVTYATQGGFENALQNAGIYNGHAFSVKADESPAASKKKIVSRHSLSYIDKDEVQSELAAMGGSMEVYKLPSPSSSVEEFSPKSCRPQIVPKLNRVWQRPDIVKNITTPKPKPKPKEKKTFRTESVPPEQLEFIRVIKSQALTVDEKFKVLDSRDKLLRLKNKKEVSLKSSATVGTCPDMCPERERLMREMQHQVALYEQDDDRHVMNARKAVKQYSRSSADQEAPLPHELRPVSVLHMTMVYLMHNIMALGDMNEVNLAEWYHFLWDRTRGIRKDITQQNLCCQGAVELVEQCARFHIHCSARLVAEEPSVFDQKINTENLTKCLQTLKYMYHDLQLKNERCPNEAEFRAYIILLNISDGNFMWEVQQLRDEIQKSREVKFALEIYSAYDKRNFVKFFKLIRSTTYLNACILMRYFVQIRVTAIQMLSKCFTPPKNVSWYPIQEIKDILYFDDIDSTIDFFRTYGINVNEEKTHFEIGRRSFMFPEFPYILERSMNVERKKTCSVGETICGKEMPEPLYLKHVPQNSFDKNGYIIFNDVLRESDLKMEIPVLIKEDEDSSDVASFEPETNVIFGTKREVKKTESIFAKAVQKASDSTNIFGQKPTQSSINIFQKDPTKISDETDSTSQPFTNIFSKSTDKQTSIFATPKETSTNIFETKKSSLFSNTELPASTSAPSIFGGVKMPISSPMFGQKEEPKSGNIFGNVPQKDSSQNIFGGHAVTTKPSGGFTFFLPKTNTEKQIEDARRNIEIPTIVIEDIEKKQREEEIARKVAEELRVLEEERNRIQELLKKEIEKEEEIEREKQREKERIDRMKKVEEENRKREAEMKRKEEERRRKEEERRIREERERLERIKQEEEARLKRIQEEVERRRNLEIKQTVSMVLTQLVEDIDRNIRQETLKKINHKIQTRKIVKVIHKWRNIAAKNIKKRKAVDCSPLWINFKNLKDCAKDLHSISQDDTLELRKRYRSGKSVEIPYIETPVVTKINILELTYELIKKRLFDLKEKCQKNIFWKVSISIPDENEYNKISGRIEDTLTKYFQWEEHNNRVYYLEKFAKNSIESITYCVEKNIGLNVKKSNDSHGVIFIAQKFDSSLQIRIFENLKSFGCFVKVPLVLIVQDSTNASQYLDKLQQNGIASKYKIIEINNFSQQALIDSTDESLMFLAQNVQKSPPLEIDILPDFLTKHLGSEIWYKAKSYAKWHSEYKECMRNPNIVISVYNEALKRLQKIVTDKDCQEYSEFANEFKEHLINKTPDYLPCDYKYFPDFWNDSKCIAKIKRILRSFELPKFKEKWPPESEKELFNSISNYCATISDNTNEPYLTVFNLLMDDDGSEEILWIDAIQVLFSYKLKQQDFSVEGNKFDTSIFKNLVVVYVAEKLEEYRSSEWFYRNNPTIENFIKNLNKKKVKETKKRAIEEVEITQDDYMEAFERAEKLLKYPQENFVNTKEEIEEINTSLEDLENSIKIMKKVNEIVQKFMD